MKIAAQVVLINQDGLFLGVSRKNNHYDFGLCGGKMEPIDDGDPKKTAIREALEETGLIISNLRLVFAMHKDGYMGYTYLADYEGEINHNEPHVVKWLHFVELTKGSFGYYNKLVGQSLEDMGITLSPKLSIKELETDIINCLDNHGYIFLGLDNFFDFLGSNTVQIEFKHKDGSYIDEDFYDTNLIKDLSKLTMLYKIKIKIPSHYFTK